MLANNFVKFWTTGTWTSEFSPGRYIIYYEEKKINKTDQEWTITFFYSKNIVIFYSFLFFNLSLARNKKLREIGNSRIF